MPKKYIAITGAEGGFGKSVCKLLSSHGFFVFALDIQTNDSPDNIIPIQVDLTNQKSINYAAQQIQQHTNCLHGLINVAGFFDQFPLVEVDPERFNQLISINMIGQQHITQALFPLLKQAKARIINLSSETVLAQMPLQAYGLSKKLFDIWSTQLRMELALLDMKVITIRAGGHKTPFIKRSIDVLSEIDESSLYYNLLQRIKTNGLKVLQKVGKDPEDVAKAVLKALTTSRPNKIYNVNVSFLFRILGLLPSGLRETLLMQKLRKWM